MAVVETRECIKTCESVAAVLMENGGAAERAGPMGAEGGEGEGAMRYRPWLKLLQPRDREAAEGRGAVRGFLSGARTLQPQALGQLAGVQTGAREGMRVVVGLFSRKASDSTDSAGLQASRQHDGGPRTEAHSYATVGTQAGTCRNAYPCDAMARLIVCENVWSIINHPVVTDIIRIMTRWQIRAWSQFDRSDSHDTFDSDTAAALHMLGTLTLAKGVAASLGAVGIAPPAVFNRGPAIPCTFALLEAEL